MSEDLTTVKNAISTFCGCVCDDIDLTVDQSERIFSRFG